MQGDGMPVAALGRIPTDAPAGRSGCAEGIWVCSLRWEKCALLHIRQGMEAPPAFSGVSAKPESCRQLYRELKIKTGGSKLC